MRLLRRPKHTNCPICGGPLSRVNGKHVCEPCNIEIKGSSLKPMPDRSGFDPAESRPNG